MTMISTSESEDNVRFERFERPSCLYLYFSHCSFFSPLWVSLKTIGCYDSPISVLILFTNFSTQTSAYVCWATLGPHRSSANFIKLTRQYHTIASLLKGVYVLY